ncbi:MAG: TSUP family transporter [Anaerolineales bacterium]|nr:TSUP family transporter [Anaerolineales bacterium]
MAENPVILFIMIAVVAFMIGVAKGGLGSGLGALATPLMALVMSPDQAIGLLLPVLMLADIFAVILHWKRWNSRMVLLLIPGSVVGVMVGTMFITNVPVERLRTAIGIITLIFALYRLLEPRIRKSLKYVPYDWHGILAGVIAGFSSSLAHTGGPPVSIYLLLQNVQARVFVATAALYYFILNWIKVPYYAYAGLLDLEIILSVIWVIPIVSLGVWIGKWGVNKVNKETFDRVIVVLLIISAVRLIIG